MTSTAIMGMDALTMAFLDLTLGRLLLQPHMVILLLVLK